MNRQRITYNGVDLVVDFEIIPAQNGGMTDPSWDEYAELDKVWWKDSDVTDLIITIDPDKVDYILDAAYEAYREEIV